MIRVRVLVYSSATNYDLNKQIKISKADGVHKLPSGRCNLHVVTYHKGNMVTFLRKLFGSIREAHSESQTT